MADFEARVKIPDRLGVVSALWTFFYEKTDDGVERNHEIHIELPGAKDGDSAATLDYVTLTTWTGLGKGQSTAAFRLLPHAVADGKFHLLRFDWQPPGSRDGGSVAFYIDDQLIVTTDTNVPSEPGNLWVGLWFPPNWAGEPDFAEVQMVVDWIRIVPMTRP